MGINEAKVWLEEQTKKLALEHYGISNVTVSFKDLNTDPFKVKFGHISAGIAIKKDFSSIRVNYDPKFVEIAHDMEDVMYATVAHELAHFEAYKTGKYHDDIMKERFHTPESEIVALKHGVDLEDRKTWGCKDVELSPMEKMMGMVYLKMYQEHEGKRPSNWGI